MLALNVSSDILRGFTLVNQSLNKSLDTSSRKNERTFDQFQFLFEQNEDKVGEWFGKASEIRGEADSLVAFIEDLKVQIVRMADGNDFRGVDPDSIQARDNLDVAGTIMVPNHPAGKKNGAILRERLNNFKEMVTFGGYTEQQRQAIARLFDTSSKGMENWETQMFTLMPVAGAVTILTQLQNSIRATEGDALEYLKSQVDADDFRVNSIEALVIPESKYVIRGGQYQAQIVLAAIDTTARPTVKIGNEIIKDGKLVRGAGTTGTVNFSGTVELVKRDGSTISYPFKSDYIVGEPSVTISADMMNVFYAGIDNPVSISVPGVPMSQITATMKGGELKKTAAGWNAIPATVSEPCVISVTASISGRTINFGSKTFRTKPLPPPVAFINYKDASGITQRYKGGTKFAKRNLLDATGVNAALDDPDLDNIPFTVLDFEINFFDSMGNTIIELSNGNKFSDRQMQQMRGLASGRQFYITKTRAVGPDKVTRILPPIQVIVQ
jgi:gliding motility-associated protein GldM